MQRIVLPLAAILILVAVGCNNNGNNIQTPDYKTVAADPQRDTPKAQVHNASAAKLLACDELQEAEKELKAALKADLFFGPAHNNLGTVYYRQQKFYLAAWEFQYAAKLMPNKAEPRNNLGMVFEAVGKLDDATKSYEEAVALEPEATEIVGNLARAYVKNNRKDEKTKELLTKIVMKDDRPPWVTWAKEHLATLGTDAASQPNQN